MIDSDTLKILNQFWDRKEETKAFTSLMKELIVGVGELVEQMEKPDDGDAAIAKALEGLTEVVRNLRIEAPAVPAPVVNVAAPQVTMPAPEMKGWKITIRSRDLNGKAQVIELDPKEE